MEPALRFVRQSPFLEAAFAFTVIILDTLVIVGDQLNVSSCEYYYF
jgi:hypothetical protein